MIVTTLKGILRRTPLEWYGAGFSPALTYHTCYRSLPPDLDPMDNVTPERLHEQISDLKRRYAFVAVDEYCRAKNRKGLATVTFDDGNKSVIGSALPVLAGLDVPFTVFVNTLGMERRVFWRLKVLIVMRHGLVAECEASFRNVRKLPGLGFHQYTKHTRNNSIVVEREIDDFLCSRGLAPGPMNYVFDDLSYFKPHPLLWFGNHTANHFVLGSLNQEEQCAEISAVRGFLAKVRGIQRSEAFAAPFGEERHINNQTFAALRDLGYRYLLVNRGGVNRAAKPRFGIEIVERFTALDEDIEWQLKWNAVRRSGRFTPIT
jgi:peptidoglycan/xylan/chitin deacetylase (PgdA/CDA1 family)